MENQNAELAEAKKGLDETEFGIRQGAEFKPERDPILEVREDGTVTITLSYRIIDKKDLVIGANPPAPIPPHFDVYGVFKKREPNNFDGFNHPKTIKVDVSSSERITIESIAGINLITKADKRESGSGII